MEMKANCFSEIIAVLVACGVLSACSLPDPKKLDSEAVAKVSEILKAQEGHWDSAALFSSMDPRSNMKREDTDSICALYESAIGSLESETSIKNVSARANVGINLPEFVGVYSADLACKKAKGTANVTVQKRDGKWYVIGFNVTSPAIDDALKADQKSAASFVDKFIPSFCKDWKEETLELSADPDLKAQLSSNPIPTKAFIGISSKGLGPIKNYEGAKFANYTFANGRKVVSLIAKAEFANGRAEIPVTVSRSAEDWKVRAINFNIRSK